MLALILFLIIFFVILLVYQIFLAYFNNNSLEGFKEGLKYEKYNLKDTSNNSPLELQNANNVSVLNSQFFDMSSNIANIQQQVNGLVNSQQQYASQMTGGSAPDITGTTDDDDGTTNGTTNDITNDTTNNDDDDENTS